MRYDRRVIGFLIRDCHRMRRAALGVAALVCACGDGEPQKKLPVPDIAPTAIDFTAVDESVDPCEDFYHYACGDWIDGHPLPSGGGQRRRFDDAFIAQIESLHQIMEADASGKRAADDPEAQRLGDYYQSCMDAPTNTKARAALAALMQPVLAIDSSEQLAKQAAALRALGTSVFFVASVTTDPVDPSTRVLALGQAGTQLPNRSDYLDPKNASLRDDYREHITRVGGLFPGAELDVANVLAVETALAQAARDPAAERDSLTMPMTLTYGELTQLAPHFPWRTYFDASGFPDLARVIVSNRDYFTALDALLASTALPALANYMTWQLLEDKVGLLDDAATQRAREFWSEHYGVTQPTQRWPFCYQSTLTVFANAISQPYVSRLFRENSRDAARDILVEIRAEMAMHLTAADWLDAPTREAAMTKLDAMIDMVGYPDNWPSFDGLVITPDSFLDNTVAAARFMYADQAAHFDDPAERETWRLAPIAVNAAYDPSLNAMQFPAGILHLPFFAIGYSAASNYGGIGAIMGHELTHGFDDQGRAFDQHGALRDWWTPDVADAFRERAQCLVDQFSSYRVAAGVNIDGQLTLGENTADLGGLLLAYDAMHRAGNQEAQRSRLDGDQQFFLAFAQLYCETTSADVARQNALSDPHSPGEFRVNGTLANVPAFAKAFECSGAAPTAGVAGRSQTCQIW